MFRISSLNIPIKGKICRFLCVLERILLEFHHYFALKNKWKVTISIIATIFQIKVHFSHDFIFQTYCFDHPTYTLALITSNKQKRADVILWRLSDHEIWHIQLYTNAVTPNEQTLIYKKFFASIASSYAHDWCYFQSKEKNNISAIEVI